MTNEVATTKVQIKRQNTAICVADTDTLAVEAPLEIRLEFGPLEERQIKNISVTMRTPGDDIDLTTGFLFTEGIVRNSNDLLDVLQLEPNVALARLHPKVEVEMGRLDRNFYTTSSCGVCGKSSIDALQMAIPGNACFTRSWEIDAAVMFSLPDTLRKHQVTFESTGGIHAAALFTPEGKLLVLREDVGRHNALDKIIGHFFREARLPLQHHILLLSGRASFELIQKAAMAGITVVAAVGAPSSLAVETANSFNMTLIGFLRDERFNYYS